MWHLIRSLSLGVVVATFTTLFLAEQSFSEQVFNGTVPGSGMGQSISMHGDTTFTGSFGQFNTLHSFEYTQTGWQIDSIEDRGQTSSEAYGIASAIWDSGHIVCNPLGDHSNGTVDAGLAEVYDNTGSLTQVLTDPGTPDVFDLFCTAVTVTEDGEWIFIGASNDEVAQGDCI